MAPADMVAIADTAELVDIAGTEDSVDKDKVEPDRELGPMGAVALEATAAPVAARGVPAGDRIAVGDWTKPF